MKEFPSPIDLRKVKVYPLADRQSLSGIDQLLVDPAQPAASCASAEMAQVEDCVKRVKAARDMGASVILLYGAHLIKNGAQRIVNELIAGGWVTHLATNGAGSIHDWELSFLGRTEESVKKNVATGTFGTWDETGRCIHLALLTGALKNEGYGRSLGRFISEEGATLPSRESLEEQLRCEPAHPLTPARAELLQTIVEHKLPSGRIEVKHRWKESSILCQSFRHNVPFTVHPGIGYDIISNHPIFNGANYIEKHGPALLSAIFILVAGVFIARWVGKLAMRWLERKELQLEPPVRMLIVRLLRLVIVVFALVIAGGTAGVDVTAMVASIGVAGVGIGLAMQGVLSNVVAGLTIIFTKPFRVGEYIELLSVQGQVATIELFSTTLLHTDRSRVVIPNRKIVGEILHNYGTIRQLDLSVGVSYQTDLTEAMGILREVLEKNSRVLKEPVAAVGVTSLGDSCVNIAVKPWTTVVDFGSAAAELNQAILEQFRLKRIEMPFPQREIRLLHDDTSSIDNNLPGAQSLRPARPEHSGHSDSS